MADGSQGVQCCGACEIWGECLGRDDMSVNMKQAGSEQCRSGVLCLKHMAGKVVSRGCMSWERHWSEMM
eukprot:7611220-Karenia_brevis.AAC.1